MRSWNSCGGRLGQRLQIRQRVRILAQIPFLQRARPPRVGLMVWFAWGPEIGRQLTPAEIARPTAGRGSVRHSGIINRLAGGLRPKPK